MQLLIMAAGAGSRYGGLKQIDGFGPNGETIMEYSVYDALRCGFEEVIFVIGENMVEDFKEKFDHNFGGKAKISHAIQYTDIEIDGGTITRNKPWGTAHAILSARKTINDQFVVINADDFYGHSAFRQITGYFTGSNEVGHYAMVGYRLVNTIPESGSVARGICTIDEDNYLISINEKTQITRYDDVICHELNGEKEYLSPQALVSMNFWAFDSSIFSHIDTAFMNFIHGHSENRQQELFISDVLNNLLRSGEAKIKLIESQEPWFGVTYRSDKKWASTRIHKLIDQGVYPGTLWQ